MITVLITLALIAYAILIGFFYNGWWKAVTLNGTWWAHDEGHWRLAGGQWSGQVSDGNLSTAQDLCESDYIERCSEFLRVAGPGECVVMVDDLIALLSIHNVGACCGDIDKIVERLTAAIDAASKEESCGK